jgi:uncharacterized protein YecT (DUF1311 family)
MACTGVSASQSESPIPAQTATVSPPAIATIEAQMNLLLDDIRRLYANQSEFLAALEAAQSAWLTFRKAHLEARYPASDKRSAYGSIYPRCYQMAYVALTQTRIAQLQQWVDGVPEGEVCAGSIRFE